MSSRKELIVKALRHRSSEVCRTALQVNPHSSSDMSGFISDLQKYFQDALKGHQFKEWTAPETWLSSGLDSLAAMRILAKDQELECSSANRPDERSFIKALEAAARDPQERFALLNARYGHPLNFTAPSELKIREYLLERLMVADRARIERDGLLRLNSNDLLLKLNLIAINASVTEDFRYLDALNYYYELLPIDWSPRSAHWWLRMSFFAFYVRALSVRSAHIN